MAPSSIYIVVIMSRQFHCINIVFYFYIYFNQVFSYFKKGLYCLICDFMAYCCFFMHTLIDLHRKKESFQKETSETTWACLFDFQYRIGAYNFHACHQDTTLLLLVFITRFPTISSMSSLYVFLFIKRIFSPHCFMILSIHATCYNYIYNIHSLLSFAYSMENSGVIIHILTNTALTNSC